MFLPTRLVPSYFKNLQRLKSLIVKLGVLAIAPELSQIIFLFGV